MSDDWPPAEVRFAARRWEVVAGRHVTFGRGASCDIRFGADPLDDFVSRTAGSLTGLADGVLVRNTSSTKSITLFAVPGPETTIRPGAAVGTMPHFRCQLGRVSQTGGSGCAMLDRCRALLS
ncbi:hypothetical protein [Pseudonocardia phyllosphaerae]|uniref:hypothetical protein n=1 Tax=Pseudonocardia phyllosphaerae TaxID=3390502 RepID=UPI0039793817